MEPEKQYLDKQEYYQILRSRIEFAYSDVNNRMIWLMITQSFFFGAYVGVVNAPAKPKGPEFEEMQWLLLWMIPVAALASGVFSYLGVLGTLMDTPKFPRYFNDVGTKVGVEKELPPLDGTKYSTYLRNISPIVLPLIFNVMWTIILLKQL